MERWTLYKLTPNCVDAFMHKKGGKSCEWKQFCDSKDFYINTSAYIFQNKVIQKPKY